MGEVYSVNQIIGRTLFAKVRVNAYTLPDYTGYAQLWGSFAPGTPIGVVDSWVQDRATGAIWWAFRDVYGKAYYVKHVGGAFDVDALKDQGALTVEEQRAAEDAKNNPWYVNLITQYGKPLVITAVGVTILTSIIRGYFSRPRN